MFEYDLVGGRDFPAQHPAQGHRPRGLWWRVQPELQVSVHCWQSYRLADTFDRATGYMTKSPELQVRGHSNQSYNRLEDTVTRATDTS